MVVTHALEGTQPEDLADHRGVQEQASFRRRERVQARRDDAPHAGWEIVARSALALCQHGCQLLQEQRVPFRPLHDGAGVEIGCVLPGLGEQPGHKCFRGRSLQRFELQRGVGRQPSAPSWTRLEKVGPGEGEEQQWHVPDPGRQQLEQVEHALVRPMQVLQEQHRRLLVSKRLHELSRGEEQHAALGHLAITAESDEHLEV